MRKFDIKMVYNLGKVNVEHVKVDDNFDRELFAHFPFVLDKAALVKLGIYLKQKEYIATLISLHLFNGYGFEEDKSKCFLYKFSVVEMLESMNGDSLDLYFPSHIRTPKKGSTGQAYKATGYIKSILSKCGVVLGRYGGNNQKARVSMSPLGGQYKQWLTGSSTTSLR